MNKLKVFEIIADIIEVETVTENTVLTDDVWDSLAVITFISEIDNEFEVILNPEEVARAETVSHLIELL